MPEGRWCFKPSPDAPEPGPPPCVQSGAITFGSCRDLSALSRQTIGLWAKVLRALPDSRFLIAARCGPDLAERIGRRFGGEGVDPARIALRDRDPAKSRWPHYAQIDICLDVSLSLDSHRNHQASPIAIRSLDWACNDYGLPWLG